MNVLKIAAVTGSLLIAISAMAFANRAANYRATGVCEIAKAANQPQQKSATNAQKPKSPDKGKQERMGEDQMQFGNFSVSLAVKDLNVSKEFYEKLDFRHVFGTLEQNYVIMQNSTSTIGLFQGMFDENILTFNPGWNRDAETLEEFQDVRDLQSILRERGITPVTEAKAGNGPASFIIVDPDGNSILVDQHVPKPE